MVRGIYTSAVGMQTNVNRMDVLSNNIANVDTTGYKRELSIQRSFSDRLMFALGNDQALGGFTFPQDNNIGSVRLGNFVDEVHIDHSNGSFREATGPLNLAISGEGFFQVEMQGPDGDTVTRYSRNGALTVDSSRTLRTLEGNPVLNSAGGHITLPEGEILIGKNGEISVNNERIATLGLVNFENVQSLRQFGDNAFDRTDETVETPFTGQVISGFLETSNVNPVREMVEMITITRNYETNSKALSMADELLGRAVNEIASR